MKVQLKYPIFIFSKEDNMVYVFWKEVKITSRKYAQENRSTKDICIDSTGMKYIGKELHITGWAGICGFTGGHFNVVKIDQEYEDNPEQISLRELQDMINDRYPHSRWFNSQGYTKAEFEQAILQCTTFEQVAELLRCRPSENFFTRLIKGY